MEFVKYTIKDVLSEYSKTQTFKILEQSFIGQAFNVKKQKNIIFIHLIDGSTVKSLQCIIDKNFESFDELSSRLTKGTCIEITGFIKESLDHEGKVRTKQPLELQVTKCIIVGDIQDVQSYPFTQNTILSRETMRSIPHIRHHSLLFLAIQIIKQKTYEAIHQAFSHLKVGEIQPTEITENECEDGAFPFTVTSLPLDENKQDKIDWNKDFFNKKVYLTVSSQLHLEATLCGTKRDSYCMTVAFRAEPSDTIMHLAEFCMPEWELVGSIEKNIAFTEFMLKHVFKHVLEECHDELIFLEDVRIKQFDIEKKNKLEAHKGQLDKINKKDWKIIQKQLVSSTPIKISLIDRLNKYKDTDFIKTTHAECVTKMLKDQEEHKVQFIKMPSYDDDLSREHERYITDVMFDGLPVFVKRYPKKVKAFYMPVVDQNSEIKHVENFDLLFPYIGEVVGGSQRIHDHNELVGRMKELDMKTESLQWYIDLRKYGTVPHGGAGLGLGRLFMVLTDITNIRDLQEFPRAYGLNCFG